jgi:hypothetical protein
MRSLFVSLTRIVVLGLLGAVASAQPATRPASAPTSVPADASTPQGALKQLSLAMLHGDQQEMRQLMLWENEQEQKVVEAKIAESRAYASFRSAAVAAFGEAKAAEVTGDFARQGAEQLAAIDAAEVKNEADHASVTVGQLTYNLKKLDGRWKVSIKGLLTGATPQIIDLMLRDMSDQTSVIQEMANEVAAGNYKTTDEVAAAFKAKVIRMQMQRTAEAAAAASTEPATTQPIDGK